jgi:sialic acid synthase SpsE
MENIWVKRPGTGSIKAEKFDQILGKTALNDLPKDIHLSAADIADFT